MRERERTINLLYEFNINFDVLLTFGGKLIEEKLKEEENSLLINIILKKKHKSMFKTSKTTTTKSFILITQHNYQSFVE